MKFLNLSVLNLRAIRRFEIDDLGSFVVVAGQNGCGKSCVFDAIRLLKSVYGGYSANEYQQWFGEFQINLADQSALPKLFRDVDKPIRIAATISFTDGEIAYLRDNAEALAQPIAWQEVTGQTVDYWTYSRAAVATQLRSLQPALNARTTQLAQDVREALASSTFPISLEIRSDGEMETTECKPAEVAFQVNRPEHLGVVEYHSASRSYSRQQVGGINLDARSFEDQQRQQRLYNWQGKYQNVKTELATSYLRNLIAKEHGSEEAADDLNNTLRELFQTFFPDKEYLGVRPQPHGSLDFPVRLSTGEVHDIDELSSGEKEILYGYLRLKNSTPRNSVILLDEPELHLNPSLLQGFTDFYYRHLGVEQGNQLWLVTHSDTLLRQAVGNANYRVYQMIPATAADPSTNQAVEVVADSDVERVTIELVGDLASYRPHGKVVILEGATEHGFDVSVVRRLFPDFARRVNLVSGGSKRRVRDLYATLRDAADQAGIKNRFFAIVDRDSEAVLEPDLGASDYTWDVYHIENYLLDAGAIRAATSTLLGGNDPFDSDDLVLAELRDCAAELVGGLVLERLVRDANALFVGAINLGGRRDTATPADEVLPSIVAALDRIEDLREKLALVELRSQADAHRSTLEAALATEAWLKEFPGRLILRRFATKNLSGRIDALLFSNLVLDKMVERGVEPGAMKAVLDQIAAQ